MTSDPKCPKCNADNAYSDGNLWNCPSCFHEWNPLAPGATQEKEEAQGVRDAHGNALADGDSVTIIKDLKVKGSSSVVKVGTKVKSIRIIDGADGHNIDCKIEGFGAMNLKSEFVKKSL